MFKDLAQKAGKELLPVDSEHNAVHQCLRGGTHGEVRRLVSGRSREKSSKRSCNRRRLVPLRELRLLNTYPGLVLPYLTFAMPLAVWLLVGFFRQLPAAVEQAALMDGAGRLRILWEIVLPLSWPGIASVAILTFLYSWNEFLFALSFTLGPERYTVPVAITLFRGQYQVPWGQILAAAIVATLPVAAIVMVAQRRIVSGLTEGAVKG